MKSCQRRRSRAQELSDWSRDQADGGDEEERRLKLERKKEIFSLSSTT